MSRGIARVFKWILYGCLLAPVMVVGLQAALFHFLYYGQPPLQPADAIVVFDGESRRPSQGFALLNRHLSRTIIVSPSTPARMETFQARWSPDMAAVVLAEPHARTTYENAYYCAAIIRSAGMKSVILVTSAEHMPRSYLLLRGLLLGHGVTVQRHAVAHDPPGSGRNRSWVAEKKVLFNEMVKLWGSLYEWGYHQLTGSLAPRDVRESTWVDRLEKWLLFE